MKTTQTTTSAEPQQLPDPAKIIVSKQGFDVDSTWHTLRGAHMVAEMFAWRKAFEAAGGCDEEAAEYMRYCIEDAAQWLVKPYNPSMPTDEARARMTAIGVLDAFGQVIAMALQSKSIRAGIERYYRDEEKERHQTAMQEAQRGAEFARNGKGVEQ